MPRRRPTHQASKAHAQHRCPGCRYFHTGLGTLCETCQSRASTDGISLTLEHIEADQNSAALPTMDGSDALVAVATSVEGSARHVPSDGRHRPCACCAHPRRAMLDAAMYDPLNTMRTIAARFDCTLYALTHHRRECLGIPP